MGSPAVAVVQENFGCSVANRFCQLLDDASDPLDILREVERGRQQQRQEQQQRKKRDEAAGVRGWRESQKERSDPRCRPAAGVPPQPGQKQTPKLGEHQGFNNRGAEVKRDKTEWRPSYREFGSNGRRQQTEFVVERSTEKSDRGRPVRGRGRGRGGRINRGFDDSGWKGKWEFQRQSVKGKTTLSRRMKADDERSGSGTRSWRIAKNDTSGKEQTAPKEETADTAEQSRASEGEPLKKVAEGETMEELVQEMTLDEWKNLQQQSRPKPEFNIRKTESTVPSKAVVIHKSKYRDDLQKEYLDDTPVIRRPVNDITSQLDINFGNLSRPGCGSRGARRGRGRGHGRQTDETRSQPEVQLVAPNPDDPEDFPALA